MSNPGRNMAESAINLEKFDESKSEVDLEYHEDDSEGPKGPNFFEKNHALIMRVVKLMCLALWCAFLGYGTYYFVAVDPEHDVILYYWGLTGVAVFIWFMGHVVNPVIGPYLSKAGDSFSEFNDKNWKMMRFVWVGAWLAFFFGTSLGFGLGSPIRFLSLVGYVVYPCILYALSTDRKAISPRTVLGGLVIQYLMALFVLKTFPGQWFFSWLGDIVNTFLNCVSAGAGFVFGEGYQEHFFAFSVLPTICYFSTFTAVMYYIGAMGYVIKSIAVVIQAFLGTSAAETLSASGNIFVGQTEAPLLIKPFFGDMTKSEIHAVMTGGFATVAGGVMAAFIGMGVSAEHLMAASVMAAPCALAMSKISCPETEQSKTAKGVAFVVPKGDADSIISAAATGASDSIPLMLNVGAMLIAFLSLLEAINQLLHSLGGCIGVPGLSVELICQYLFLPAAYLLGCTGNDALLVAQLIGKKLILNEFVGYGDLSVLIANRKCGREPHMSQRAEVIATYAMCGFANFGSIGIQIGGLTPLAPHRAKDISALVVRAMFTGTFASFVNANLAGYLYTDEEVPVLPPYPESCNVKA